MSRDAEGPVNAPGRTRTRRVLLAAAGSLAAVLAMITLLTWPAVGALATGITGGASTSATTQTDASADGTATCPSGAGDDGAPATPDPIDLASTPPASAANPSDACAQTDVNATDSDTAGDSTGFGHRDDGGSNP